MTAQADTAPGTYGEHPTAPQEIESTPAPLPASELLESIQDWTGVAAHVGAILGLLAHVDSDIHKLMPQPDVFQVFMLNSAPRRLDRFGRRFTRILVSATVSVTVETGIGNITLNLAAGWNVLNFPDGAYISTAGTAANVLYLASDSQNG